MSLWWVALPIAVLVIGRVISVLADVRERRRAWDRKVADPTTPDPFRDPGRGELCLLWHGWSRWSQVVISDGRQRVQVQRRRCLDCCLTETRDMNGRRRAC